MAKMLDGDHKNKPSRPTMLVTYSVHVAALKRFVLRLLGNQNDVDDVVQEVFLRAYSAEKNTEISEPKSYLFRIAKNVALNELRQKTRRPTDYLEDFESSDLLASDWTLEDEIMAQQKLEIHCAAVASLPPTCRKVYLMRKVYGMSIKEISDALDISTNTVENHITKGFSRCDTYVEERLGDIRNGGSHYSPKKRGV